MEKKDRNQFFKYLRFGVDDKPCDVCKKLVKDHTDDEWTKHASIILSK